MATSTPGGHKPASTTKRTSRRTSPGATATGRTSGASASAGRRTTAQRTTPPTTLAERAVLVPVGAGLLASDNLVSTVKGLASKYRSRSNLERELKRYERRGVTARNRFERQVRRARTRVERDLRQNRRRVGRELSSVRRDFEKQSGAMGARVERLVSNAQGLIGS